MSATFNADFFMTTVTKEKKKEIIENLRENITKQEAILFVNFKGMKGEEVRSLREGLKKSGSKMIVARKTLAKIAFEKEKMNFDPLLLDGEVGFTFAMEDGIGTAKVLRNFEKEEAIAILGGIYEGKALSAEETRSLADLPSREELLAKFLGTLSAPMGGFASVLEGNIKGLINVLDKKAKV